MSALNAVRRSDLEELKSMTKPPPKAAKVLEALCVLLGVGGAAPTWADASTLLLGVAFPRALSEFDKDSVSAAALSSLTTYVDDPEFTPEAVGKASSSSVAALCAYVRGMHAYCTFAAARRATLSVERSA